MAGEDSFLGAEPPVPTDDALPALADRMHGDPVLHGEPVLPDGGPRGRPTPGATDLP